MRRVLGSGSLLVLVAWASGCAAGPAATAAAYADALEEGRVEEAAALLDPAFLETEAGRQYLASLASPERRRAEVDRIRAAARGAWRLEARGPGGVRAAHDGHRWRLWPVQTESPQPSKPVEVPPSGTALAERVHTVVAAFVKAVRSKDFEAAAALLAPELRLRYTPARLAADFRSGGKAGAAVLEEIERALAAKTPPVRSGEIVLLPLGGGRAVRLVETGGTLSILSLH